MIFFAALMMWAFPYRDYRRPADEPATTLWRPLWDRCVFLLKLDVLSDRNPSVSIIVLFSFVICGL
jgi:hypothetical protein